jgi:hypothetical protein
MAKQKVRYTRSGVFLRLRPYTWYAEGAKMRPEGSALLKGGLNRTLGVRHDAGDRTFCDAIEFNAPKQFHRIKFFTSSTGKMEKRTNPSAHLLPENHSNVSMRTLYLL